VFRLRPNGFTRSVVFSLIFSQFILGCSRERGGSSDLAGGRGTNGYDESYDPLAYDDGGTGTSGSNLYPTSDDVNANGQVDQGTLSDLAAMMAALSPEKQEQTQNMVLNALDSCSFLGAPVNSNADAQCKNGDPKGCAGLLLNLGKSYFGSLLENGNLGGQNISALINQNRAMCSALDFSNPQKVMSQLEKLRNGCVKEKKLSACIGLLFISVGLFLKGILGQVLGKLIDKIPKI